MNERGGSGKRRVHLGRSISNSAEQKPRLSARKGGQHRSPCVAPPRKPASLSAEGSPVGGSSPRRGRTSRASVRRPGLSGAHCTEVPLRFRRAQNPARGPRSAPERDGGAAVPRGPLRGQTRRSPQRSETRPLAARPPPPQPRATAGTGRPGKRRARSEENYRCAGQTAPQLCSRAHA